MKRFMLIILVIIAFSSILKADEVFYDITFSSPEHTVGYVPVTGSSPTRPSQILFGAPIVSSSLGLLQNQPLVFNTTGNRPSFYYDQIILNVGKNAAFYYVAFDVLTQNLIGSTNHFVLVFDTPSVRTIVFRNNGTIYIQNTGDSRVIGNFTENTLMHCEVYMDMIQKEWTIFVNNNQIHSGLFQPDNDIESIRFALGLVSSGTSPDHTTNVGLDNIIVADHVVSQVTPPVADADGPYIIYVGDTLTLDASGSTDVYNDIVSYVWDLDDNGSFETDAGGQPVFDVNYASLQSLGLIINYTYNIHLKVTDSEGKSDVDDSTLTIIPKPEPMVYYVDTDANGANDGFSWADAYNYLQDALANASSGDEIRVAQGIYRPSELTLPLPGQVSEPNPADGATDVNLPTPLSWTAGVGADSYKIYFGTSSPPPFVRDEGATMFYPGTLDDYTTYYWRIDSINVWGKTTGITWSFTTGEMLPPPPPPPPGGGPGNASNPYPADEATNVSITADLSWTAGSRTTSHDVYFGTSSMPPFIGNQIPTTFDPGTMDEGTTYYWSIDELNNYGTNTGEIWSFTTTAVTPPPPPPPPPPGLGENMEQATATAVSRENTFQLINGVVIKGGYAGFGEPDPNARDIDKYKTILSGDLQGNDVGGFNDFSKRENSYHVVTGSGCDESAVFDGFTITGGNDDRRRYDYYPIGHGSGMLNESGSPTVSNCTFTCNYASDTGGGMFNETGNPTLTNCTFIGNSAGGWAGGGMFNWESSPAVTNCTFISNSSKEWGGAICNYKASSPTLSNCIFRRNSITMWGGAICNVEASSPMLSNCTFNGNSARNGGGMYNHKECSPTLTNCIFTGNSAVGEYGDGGGMFNNKSGPRLTNCTFAGNKADKNGRAMAGYGYAIQTLTICILWDGGDEIYNIGGSVTMITYSDVHGGWPGAGNIDVDPCFVETEYLGPISYWKFDEALGTIAYDSVGNNHGNVYGAQWTTGQVGSALVFDGMDDYVDIPYDSSLDIDASQGITLSVWIKLNSYPGTLNQGPIFGLYYSTGAGTKNYLSIMKSTYGNVISWDQWPKTSYGWIESIKPDLDTWYHVVVVEDSSYRAIYINGSLDVSDNTPELYEGNPPDTIRIGSRADDWAPDYFHGTIDEVAIYDRVLFAEEIWQLYESPNYRLQPDSPCINAGDPNYVPEPNETDLDGNPRVIGAAVDMGAYEFQNTLPVANAGPDQVLECGCNTGEGTKVTLDGSSSYDADGDPLTYTWTGPFIESPANGAAPTVILGDGCPGEYVITLVVNDGIEDSEPNEVVLTVVDTTPPDFSFSVTPTILWPPNHKMVLITPSWTVSDKCDVSPDVLLVSIAVNEGNDAKGDGRTSDDIQIAENGSIYLRAERSGTGDDRIYTITYQAVDDSGNAAVRSATVSIPHDFKVLARIAPDGFGPAHRQDSGRP